MYTERKTGMADLPPESFPESWSFDVLSLPDDLFLISHPANLLQVKRGQIFSHDGGEMWGLSGLIEWGEKSILIVVMIGSVFGEVKIQEIPIAPADFEDEFPGFV